MSTNPTDILTQITDAEVALLKGPLLAFAQALQAPGANILTATDAAKNVLLQVPQLSAPAQSAVLNIVGAGLAAKISSIGNPPSILPAQPSTAA